MCGTGLPGAHCLTACDEVGSRDLSYLWGSRSPPLNPHTRAPAQPCSLSPELGSMHSRTSVPPPPQAPVLAHRIHKGNSENVVSEEKQFFLQQAPLSVLLCILREERLSQNSGLPFRPSLALPSPCVTELSSPHHRLCADQFGPRVSRLCSRRPQWAPEAEALMILRTGQRLPSTRSLWFCFCSSGH